MRWLPLNPPINLVEFVQYGGNRHFTRHNKFLNNKEPGLLLITETEEAGKKTRRVVLIGNETVDSISDCYYMTPDWKAGRKEINEVVVAYCDGFVPTVKRAMQMQQPGNKRAGVI